MPRPCIVCMDARLPDIELDLQNGMTQRLVAEKYGLNKSSIGRHAVYHWQGSKGEESLPDEEDDSQGSNARLISKIEGLVEKMEKVTRAKKVPAYTVVAATGELRALLVLWDKANDRQLDKTAIVKTDNSKLLRTLEEVQGKLTRAVDWTKANCGKYLTNFCDYVDGEARFPQVVVTLSEGGKDGNEIQAS